MPIKLGLQHHLVGNEFQVGTTRDEKKYLVLLHLATGTANLNLCPLWVEIFENLKNSSK